jgi:hypothetical protein
MRTEVTFGRGIVVGIDVQGVIGTGLHATLAADASLIVKIDDSVGAPVEGFGGANGNAGGRIAVVTSHHPEVAAGVRKFALLDVLHPGAKDAQWNLVFLLARHRAGVTTDTSILIYDESVSHTSEFDIVLEGMTGECRG